MANPQSNYPLDEARIWFENIKSDLTNPFQSRDQLQILIDNHDRMEARMKENNTKNYQNQHDFYAEAIRLVSEWKEGQDKLASAKPAVETAKEAAQKWGVGLFEVAGISTAGKSFDELAAQRTVLPSGARSYYESQISSAKEQLALAREREARDPSAKWDIEYWTAYQAEIAGFKQFIDQSTQARIEETKAGTYVPPPLPEHVVEARERMEGERVQREYAEEQARIEAENKAKQEAANPKDETAYLWWGIGIAAAGILLFAVFA